MTTCRALSLLVPLNLCCSPTSQTGTHTPLPSLPTPHTAVASDLLCLTVPLLQGIPLGG